MKVTVVGAGNVGATVANVLAVKNFCSEVMLVDIKKGFAEGKAMDIMQTAHLLNFDTTVTGVTAEIGDENGYAPTEGSDVVVVTSGMPRKPGMTREELIGVNAKIVKGVVDQALKYSPNAIFIIISNPMDAMTFLTQPRSRSGRYARQQPFPLFPVQGSAGSWLSGNPDGHRRHGYRRPQRQDHGSSDEPGYLSWHSCNPAPYERTAG